MAKGFRYRGGSEAEGSGFGRRFEETDAGSRRKINDVELSKLDGFVERSRQRPEKWTWRNKDYVRPFDDQLNADIAAYGGFASWFLDEMPAGQHARNARASESVAAAPDDSEPSPRRSRGTQRKENYHGPSQTEYATSQDRYGPTRWAEPPASPVKAPKIKTSRELLDAAAARLHPTQKFFDEEINKGVRGNVSPANKKSLKGDAKTREARSAEPTTTTHTSNSSLALYAIASGVVEEPCVERPTGNVHGPGKWRGQRFNWCK